jgi:hypothetical protein
VCKRLEKIIVFVKTPRRVENKITEKEIEKEIEKNH